MILTKGIATLLFTIYITISFSQTQDYSSIIFGTWVTTTSLLKNEIESPDTSPYSKYQFFGDGRMCFATNEYERGKEHQYTIDGNKLQMLGITYDIKSYDGKAMKLVSETGYEFTLVRKKEYDAAWSALTNEKLPDTKPVFTGKFYLYDYLFSDASSASQFERMLAFTSYSLPTALPKQDIIVKISLTVDSIGNVKVSEVKTTSQIGDKRAAKIKSKFENTSGYWLPATQMGKDKTFAFDLTFINRSATSLDFRTRAEEHFKKAHSAISKRDFNKGIQLLTDAISLDSEKFTFYLLRAACHLNLEDVDKYCEDILRARILNPFINSTNQEIVSGESLEIKCIPDAAIK